MFIEKIGNVKIVEIHFKEIQMCEHRRKKKNYPFGMKSEPVISCKSCGNVLMEINKGKIKRK